MLKIKDCSIFAMFMLAYILVSLGFAQSTFKEGNGGLGVQTMDSMLKIKKI
jgi:hypothetical protein